MSHKHLAASGVTTALQAPRLLQDVLMGGGKAEASAPLYRRSYDNASVLICKILVSVQHPTFIRSTLHLHISSLLYDSAISKDVPSAYYRAIWVPSFFEDFGLVMHYASSYSDIKTAPCVLSCILHHCRV